MNRSEIDVIGEMIDGVGFDRAKIERFLVAANVQSDVQVVQDEGSNVAAKIVEMDQAKWIIANPRVIAQGSAHKTGLGVNHNRLIRGYDKAIKNELLKVMWDEKKKYTREIVGRMGVGSSPFLVGSVSSWGLSVVSNYFWGYMGNSEDWLRQTGSAAMPDQTIMAGLGIGALGMSVILGTLGLYDCTIGDQERLFKSWKGKGYYPRFRDMYNPMRPIREAMTGAYFLQSNRVVGWRHDFLEQHDGLL